MSTIKVEGASAGAGAGRVYGVAPGRGRPGKVGHARVGDSRTQKVERERSASTHAMRLQFWETVHASDELGRATTVARIVRRARVKM
eukprot:5056002-Pleurochrysis_carterae.AAC.1